MRYVFIAILFFVCAARFSFVEAKENKDLMKANYYYSHYIYYEAIPYYEKVADTLKNPFVYAKLADCYSVTGDVQKAAATYAKAVADTNCNSDVQLRYAQLLMQLTQYDEAEKWLKEYQKKNGNDKRIANLIGGCELAKASANAVDSFPPGVFIMLPCNTEGSDFAPTLWKGRLVFASDTAADVKKKTDNWTGKSYYNLYSVSCTDDGQVGNDFTALTGTKEVNIKYHNGPCTFSADGRQMYYTRSSYNDNFFGKKAQSNKDSMVALEIMVASDYNADEKKFKTITPFQYNNKDYAVAHAAISPGGKVLAFSSTMPKGHGRTDIYICHRLYGGWSQPINAGDTVNTEGDELFPFWADDSTLFFSSDGHKGFGGLDIYKCSFDANTNTFSLPEHIEAPVNSSYDDISLAIHTSGKRTWFSSNRPAAKGGDNIYFFKKEKIFLKLNVFDSVTRKPLAAAGLVINTANRNKDTLADNAGQFFTRLYPDQEYTIEAAKDGYVARKIAFRAATEKLADTIVRDIYLPLFVRDTVQIPPEKVTLKHLNVMDTPGVQVFELNAIYEIGHFYYDYNKYELTEDHQVFLDTLQTMLTRHPSMRIEIRAHTDCRGSDALNMTLSNNRALSVVSYLVKHGIARNRLEHVGLGATMPVVKCPVCEQCTEEQHYLNRILEFRVLQL